MYLENHVEGVTFQPHEAGQTVEVRVDAGDPAPDESHFFVAVCAHRRQLGNPTYVYVPRAANVLRERERHIALLEGELATKDEWLDKAQQDLAEFDRLSRQQKEELERSNQWAGELNQELEERRARIVELQEEFAREQESARKVAEGYAARIREQEEELERSNQWAEALEPRNSRSGARASPSCRRNSRASRRAGARWPKATPPKWPPWNWTFKTRRGGPSTPRPA